MLSQVERDYYKVLGVAKAADAKTIKSAYRTLAKELHPDRNPDDKAAEERFKDVSQAYNVLSDKKRRDLYDRFGEPGLREGFDPSPYDGFGQRHGGDGVNFNDFFSQRGGGQGFDFNLEDLLGGRSGRAPRKGRDLESEIRVGFVEAVHGCEKELSLRIEGVLKTFKARIPAGIGEGDRVRLRGKGGAGRAGDAPGDLLLTVRVDEHTWFGREGANLLLHLPITPAEAHRGAKVKVPTPSGNVQLKIPEGAQGGQRMRLKGKGIERKNKRGDLIVELQIRIPTGDSEELKAALDTIEGAFDDEVRKDLEF